ncbi:hypothetical protein A2U01_0072825, partial [Trifolium medium]|nr:hypothetical protein [Trifolium medium]
ASLVRWLLAFYAFAAPLSGFLLKNSVEHSYACASTYERLWMLSLRIYVFVTEHIPFLGVIWDVPSDFPKLILGFSPRFTDSV